MLFPIIVVGCMIAIGIVSLFVFYFRSPTTRMVAGATGKVISAEEHVRRNADRRWEETVILCEFEAQGAPHRTDITLPGRQAELYPPGRSIPVKYNPETPDECRIAL